MHDRSFGALSTYRMTACFILLVSTACAATGRDFYVAPNGSDDNPGTLEKPFSTIARARDAVRPMIATMSSDITVWIRGGRYHLSEAIALDDRDGGTGEHHVIYKNYKDEEVFVLGGVPVIDWTPYERGIMKADVGKDIEFWSLLVDDKLATMAREKSWYNRPPRSSRNLQVYCQKHWMSEYLRVTSFDAASRKMALELEKSRYTGSPRYMQGSYTFIDEPGEWAVDSDSGTLYYYPKSPAELKNVVRPTTKAIFRIRGRSESQPVRHVVIEGLRLVLTDFNANLRCYASVDDETGLFRNGCDYPNTMRTAIVTIENASNIQIRYCDMSEAPISAVSIYAHATDNTVYGCRMNNLGYMGVYLAGPWIQKQAPHINKRNTVRNCLISNLTKGVNHTAGVGIYQSGDNRIQNNMIHTSRRYAISTKGLPCGKGETVGIKNMPLEEWYEHVHSNRNVISHNYMYDLVMDSSDGGAIEFWGGGRDTVVDHNIVADAYWDMKKNGWRAHSIFFDAGMSYATVTNNIAWNTRSPAPNAACILKGVDMFAHNNVFDTSLNYLGGINNQGSSNHKVRKNIFYSDCPSMVHFDGTVGPEKDGTRRAFQFRGHSIAASMDNNVYYNAQGAWLFDEDGKEKVHGTIEEWRKVTEGKGDFDKNSLTSDPQFVDASARDYRLRETSPALDLGISSIDTFSIGLLEDFPFTPEDDPLKTAFLKANDKDVYLEAQQGEAIKLQVTGRTKHWFVADLAKADICYSVDNANVATVAKDGAVKLAGKGRACITATVTLNGVTRSDDVVIYAGIARNVN